MPLRNLCPCTLDAPPCVPMPLCLCAPGHPRVRMLVCMYALAPLHVGRFSSVPDPAPCGMGRGVPGG